MFPQSFQQNQYGSYSGNQQNQYGSYSGNQPNQNQQYYQQSLGTSIGSQDNQTWVVYQPNQLFTQVQPQQSVDWNSLQQGTQSQLLLNHQYGLEQSQQRPQPQLVITLQPVSQPIYYFAPNETLDYSAFAPTTINYPGAVASAQPLQLDKSQLEGDHSSALTMSSAKYPEQAFSTYAGQDSAYRFCAQVGEPTYPYPSPPEQNKNNPVESNTAKSKSKPEPTRKRKSFSESVRQQKKKGRAQEVPASPPLSPGSGKMTKSEIKGIVLSKSERIHSPPRRVSTQTKTQSSAAPQHILFSGEEMKSETKPTERTAKATSKEEPVDSTFVRKLYDLLMTAKDIGVDSIISFTPSGMAFRIHNLQKFTKEVSPRYFSGIGPSSFRKELEELGFDCVGYDQESMTFGHPNFRRGNFTSLNQS